jgi:phosphomevalonate kinase
MVARAVTVTVPANLLLLGEYAVLEPGGLGVALALERRVVIRVEEAPELELLGTWGGSTVRWCESEPGASPLFSQVVHTCRGYLCSVGPSGGATVLSGRVHIDSGAFYLTPERKGGFGSSAAVAVGLTWALLLLGGVTGTQLDAAAPELALRAHRAAQGGGSGYDVLTSAHGGCGLFTGGSSPRWEARSLPWLPPLYLLQGPASVSTGRAVESHRRWKAAHPSAARRFLEESNTAVRGFLAAGSWPEAEAAFRRCGDLGVRLGDQIGVEARLEVPWVLRGAAYKALGAGNELGVVAAPEAGPAPNEAARDARDPAPRAAAAAAGLELLVPAWEGVLCVE